MEKNEMLRLLQLIEQTPCRMPDDLEKHFFYTFDRVNAIDKELNGSKYHWIQGKKYYRLYAQDSLENLKEKYDKITIISSHADNLQGVSSFKKISEDLVNGCFDNASTNAVCLYMMKYLQLPENVLFVFTADEENELKGAARVSKKLKEYFGNDKVNAIVLDVTYGFQGGVDFTIENDFIYEKNAGEKFMKQVCDVANASGYTWNFLYSDEGYESDDGYVRSNTIKEYMGEGCKACDEVEGPDETGEYDDQGFNTFSQCLPCSAKNGREMHSEKGFQISLTTLSHYMDFLYRVAKASQE